MKGFTQLGMAIALTTALAIGCGQQPQPTATTSEPIDGSRFLLSREPEGAKGVREVRQNAENDDDVVVVGRIGGMENPWVEQLAAFSIVDPSIKGCHEIGDDGCPKPWDFC